MAKKFIGPHEKKTYDERAPREVWDVNEKAKGLSKMDKVGLWGISSDLDVDEAYATRPGARDVDKKDVNLPNEKKKLKGAFPGRGHGSRVVRDD